MGSVPKCSRCGRIGHLASICGAPRLFEGYCAACGEYGHLRRFCVTTRRPIPIQPHANVVTASGGGCGDSSWDHDDGGSKGVTWVDQQTGGMPSSGHFFALQFALTAAYPPDHMLSSFFPNSPPGSTVWIGDSASSVHGADSGKFVYNKRRPLSAEAFLLIGDGIKLKVECFGSLDVVFHCKDGVRVTLENVAVVPGLAFDLMSFNCIQEKHDILMNRDGTWILDGRVHFVKLPAGNYIQATRVEHGADPSAIVAAMTRPGQQRGINNDDLHISLGHTNDAIVRETAKQMGTMVTDTRGYCDGCGEAKVIRRAVPRKTKVKSGRPLQRVFIDPTGPYPPSRAPFVGEVPTCGGGAVMHTAVAATVTSSGVFPAASVRGAGGAPASSDVAASTVTGSGVFPAASTRGAAGASASAVVAAASAAATATAVAAVAAAIPPDGTRKTAAARGGVFPTPQVDWTTARRDQHSETATARRGPRTAGGFGFRLGDARNVRAYSGGRRSATSLPDLQRLGRLTGGGECLTVMQPCFVWIFGYFSVRQHLVLFIITIFYFIFLSLDLILLLV